MTTPDHTPEHHSGSIHIVVSTSDLVAAMGPEDQQQMTELGRKAYEAYCSASGGVSAVSGDVLPTWDQQLPRIQDCWVAAAVAVAREIVE